MNEIVLKINNWKKWSDWRNSESLKIAIRQLKMSITNHKKFDVEVIWKQNEENLKDFDNTLDCKKNYMILNMR